MGSRSKYLLSCCMLFVFHFCIAQNADIDSLLALIKTDKQDTTKLIHLYNLSDEYEVVGNYSDGLSYGKQALELADVILGSADIESIPRMKYVAQRYKAKTYSNIGIINTGQGNFPEALKNHFTALKIKQAIDDKAGIASSYNSIGVVNAALGNYPEALKHYFACVKIMEVIGNKKGVAVSYNNIGAIYYSQGNYSDALKNYLIALKIRESELAEDKAGVADSYLNVGNVYFAEARQEKVRALHFTKLEQALKNYSISLKIYETIDDKEGVATSYNNMGNVYYDYAEQEISSSLRNSKFDQGLKNYLIALNMREAIGDKVGVAASNGSVGNVYVKLKKYEAADKYLNKAKDLFNVIGHKEYLRDTYIELAKLDSARGNYKGAYENHKMYILYRDSLDNEETRKQTIQSQMTYDFEKKEAVAQAEHKKELENQELIAFEKSRKQKVVLTLVSCFLLLVIIFAGFIFRSLRVTKKQKKIIEQQKEIVERQKQEVEQQKHVVEEHQKEIIDSITYAKRIQRSLLPTERYIEKQLNRLMKK